MWGMPQRQKLNILIYGAGALGQALGCMLSQAGNKVDLLLLIYIRHSTPSCSTTVR